MKCIEAFFNKPVLVQLKNPIVAVLSAEEVTLEDGTTCGFSTIAFIEGKPGETNQPIMLQILRGEIEAVDEENFIFATTGGDNKTPVRICLERSNVGQIVFCTEHIPLPTRPNIVLPGN